MEGEVWQLRAVDVDLIRRFVSISARVLVAAAVAGCGGGGPDGGGPEGGGDTGPPIDVSATPRRAALVVGQSLLVRATVQNDPAARGVRWTATAGSFSTLTSASGAAVTFTAPSAAGVVAITATSLGDAGKSATVTIGVTDLPGVTTYHYDPARLGVNRQEYALTPAQVSAATFGKLFSCAVDGAIYAQPLWVPGLQVNGGIHNVVFVATQHDSVYAFDADANSAACVPLWHANLVDAAHGGSDGERAVPVASGLIGRNQGDIVPEVGITGTPVIDRASGTLYVVAKSVDRSDTVIQRLHALDLATGSERLNGNRPLTIAASTPGRGDGAVGGRVAFDPQTHNQRAALSLADGVVYVAWASHEDRDPYHGWLIGFDATTLAPVSALNVTPNGQRGAIWMSGGAPAHDATGAYVVTSNGTYDGVTEFGDSVLRLSPANGLAVQDWFTPADQARLEADDLDLGSGGAVLIDAPGSPVPRLLVAGTKFGSDGKGEIYVLDRDRLGGYTPADSGVVQKFPLGNIIFGTPAFWNNTLYIAGGLGPMTAFRFDPAAGRFAATAASRSAATFGIRGATPSISANGASDGIVWALENGGLCTPGTSCAAAVLRAFDARDLAVELWNSTQGNGNTAGFAVKFAVPTVANGKVYVGTRGNDEGSGTSSVPGQLDVYGLLPD